MIKKKAQQIGVLPACRRRSEQGTEEGQIVRLGPADLIEGPAIPEQPRVGVGRNLYSIRGVCVLVLGNNRELPDEIVVKLFRSMHAQHDRLREKLGMHSTYLIGARCLLELMDEREDAYKQQEERRNK